MVPHRASSQQNTRAEASRWRHRNKVWIYRSSSEVLTRDSWANRFDLVHINIGLKTKIHRLNSGAPQLFLFDTKCFCFSLWLSQNSLPTSTSVITRTQSMSHNIKGGICKWPLCRHLESRDCSCNNQKLIPAVGCQVDEPRSVISYLESTWCNENKYCRVWWTANIS